MTMNIPPFSPVAVRPKAKANVTFAGTGLYKTFKENAMKATELNTFLESDAFTHNGKTYKAKDVLDMLSDAIKEDGGIPKEYKSMSSNCMFLFEFIQNLHLLSNKAEEDVKSTLKGLERLGLVEEESIYRHDAYGLTKAGKGVVKSLVKQRKPQG